MRVADVINHRLLVNKIFLSHVISTIIICTARIRMRVAWKSEIRATHRPAIESTHSRQKLTVRCCNDAGTGPQ